MKKAYVAVIAGVIIAGTIGGVLMDSSKESFMGENEMTARNIVVNGIDEYRNDPESAFEMITAGAQERQHEEPYLFVVNAQTMTVVAHGAKPGVVGDGSASLTQSEKPYSQIMHELRSDGNTWVEYVFENPDTGIEQTKRSFLQLYDGYVFGSGYYYNP